MPRVLVVEDDADLRYLYDAVLTRGGYEVVAAESSVHAMLALTNGAFDLLIMDMGIPGRDGTHIIEFVRGDIRLRNVPIVVISANERWEEPVRGLGVKYFFVKPVTMQQLVGLTEELAGPANGGAGA